MGGAVAGIYWNPNGDKIGLANRAGDDIQVYVVDLNGNTGTCMTTGTSGAWQAIPGVITIRWLPRMRGISIQSRLSRITR